MGLKLLYRLPDCFVFICPVLVAIKYLPTLPLSLHKKPKKFMKTITTFNLKGANYA